MVTFHSNRAKNTYAAVTGNGDVNILNALAIAEGVCGVFGEGLEIGTQTGLTLGHKATLRNIEGVICNDISGLTDTSAASKRIPLITSGGDDAEIGISGNDFTLVAAVTICFFAAKGMTK
jgi:hypothetical protein